MAIPQLRLDDDKRRELSNYLQQQIETVDSGRQPLVDNYVKWTEAYEAKAIEKDFPWPKACGLTLPIVPTHTDAIHARLTNTLWGSEPPVNVRPWSRQGTEFARQTQLFLDWAVQELDLYQVYAEALYIMLKYGCVFLYVSWENRPRKYTEFGPDDQPAPVSIDLLDRPMIRPIHPKDFYIPVHERDIQESPWCGYSYKLRRGQLKEWKKLGFFNREVADQLLERMPRGEPFNLDRVQQAREQAVGLNRIDLPEELDMLQLWVRWDVDGDDLEEEVVLHIERQTGLIPRIAFPHYRHRRRPFVKHGYIRRDGMIYDIGIPEMIASLQDTGSTLLRQQIDNGTAANTVWGTYLRGSGLKVKQKIHPGFLMPVNSHEDIQERQFGRAINTTIQDIALVQQWAERRTGVSDFNLGQETGRRTPATTTLALLQESNKRLDLVVRDLRKGFQEVIMQCLELYQQFKPEVAFPVIGPEAGSALSGMWRSQTEEDMRRRVIIEATASTASLNKVVDRQDKITLLSQLQSIHQSFIQLMALAAQSPDPALRQLVMTQAHALREVMIRVLDTYDIRNHDELLPPELETLLANVQSQPLAVGANGGAQPGPAGGALEGLLGVAQGAGNAVAPQVAPNRPSPGGRQVGRPVPTPQSTA